MSPCWWRAGPFSFRRATKSDRDAKRCADECAAFLNGRALEIYGANGLLAPTWAQVNWIAHGEPTAIKDHVRSELGLRRPPGTWPWAITTMARELLARADNSNAAIRLLQRECLIPMEFALLRTDSGCFLPKHFVALGIPRLRSHPIIRRPDSLNLKPDK